MAQFRLNLSPAFRPIHFSLIPLLVFLISILALTKANERCGNKDRHSMQPFSYIPDPEFNANGHDGGGQGQQPEISILWAPKLSDNGMNAEVYIGYAGTKEEKFSADKCVAIKIGMGGVGRMPTELNGFKILREMKRHFDGKWPALIVDTRDIGKTKDDKFVTIMELADANLEQVYVPVDFVEPENQAKLTATIESMVMPLPVMHSFGVHTDLKLPNYIVKMDHHSNKVITKLIDFEAVVSLNHPNPASSSSHDAHHRGTQKTSAASASSRLLLLDQQLIPVWNQRYDNEAGPEYQDPANVMISTKTDMWTIGILIYKLILRQPKMGLHNKDDKNKRREMIKKLSEIYRGYKWAILDFDDETSSSKSTVMKSEALNFDGTRWIVEYHDTLLLILEVQTELPRIFMLISNLLSRDPKQRMSAPDVLNFLKSDCKPRSFASSAADFPLFGNVTGKELAGKIELGIERRKKALTRFDKLSQGQGSQDEELVDVKEKLEAGVEKLNELKTKLERANKRLDQELKRMQTADPCE